MALKATVFKVELQVADMERHYYQTHQLTLARHPSETDERMLVRVIAFALNASEHLEFTRGLSCDEEPDLWQKSLDNSIELWIETGQPDEKRLRKACGLANMVIVYTYAQRSATVWWEQNSDRFRRFNNLTVTQLTGTEMSRLGDFAQRNMQLQCTIQDGQIWLNDSSKSLQIELKYLKQPE